MDPDLFFHPFGERGPKRAARVSAARAVCAGCPVFAECRAHTLAVREPYGMWAGLSEEDRDRLWHPARAGGRNHGREHGGLYGGR